MIRLGTQSEIITPPEIFGLVPDGMPRLESARAVLEDLSLEVFVISNDHRSVVVSVSDQLFITASDFSDLQAIVHHHLPGAPLILCATHNHSASPIPFGSATDAKNSRILAAQTLVREKFSQGLAAAVAKQTEVEVAGARMPFPGTWGKNRRAKLENGSCISAFGAGPPLTPGTRIFGRAGGDPGFIDVLAFRQPGANHPLALLTGYASHIHFYEIPYFNGEAAGAARRALRDRCPDVHPLYAVSFAGDIALLAAHPIPGDSEEDRIRWQQESAGVFGEAFAKAVAAGLPDLDYVSSDTLEFVRHEEDTAKESELLVVETLRIGPHAVCSLPGEMFLEWEGVLRRNSPAASLLAMGYNQSWLGYVAPPLAFEEGSYEVMRGPADVLGYPSPSARVKSSLGTGQNVVDIASLQLSQLFPPNTP